MPKRLSQGSKTVVRAARQLVNWNVLSGTDKDFHVTQPEKSNPRVRIVAPEFEREAVSSGFDAKGGEDPRWSPSVIFGEKQIGNKIEMVPVSSLTAADSPRLAGENVEHIHTLAESASRLPPIIVHRDSMRVIDGMHRLQAARLRGQDQVEVCFFDGSERDAFAFAVQANVIHGLPLSSADRRAAVQRIVASHPEWSDRAVAMVAGLSAKRVAEIRLAISGETPEVKRRVGRDGRCRPVNGTEGRLLASELIKKDPDASLREIAREAGISPATVADVRARMGRGEDPVRLKQSKVTKHENSAENRNSRERATRSGDQESLAELAKAIESLRRDPSLRFNEAGRLILRILDISIFAGQKKQQIVDNLPAHQVASIAETIRKCAEILQGFADDLQHKNGSSAGLPLGGLP